MNTKAEFCGVIRWSAIGSRIAWLVICEAPGVEGTDASRISDSQATGHHLVPVIRVTADGGAVMRGGGYRLGPSDLLAALDLFSRGVPHDARVVAVGVQLEHRSDDALDRLLGVGDAREVPQICLRFADRPRHARSADALVAGDDDLRPQRCDLIET